MAKAKKTKEVEDIKIEDQSEQLQQLGNVNIQQKKIDDCEWVFQFDNDEPQVFAWTDPEMQKDEDPKVIFSISNIENSFISFKSSKDDKSFKIFARDISEEGKQLREKQRNAFKSEKNGSENQEA